MATVEDKIQRIVSRLETNTSLKNLVPGTTMHSLVESSALENMKVENAQELIDMRNSISLAIGSDLDAIGEKVFGVKRRESIAPTISANMKILKFYVASGTFGAINSTKSIVVQAGTILEGATPAGYIRFATEEEITLPYDKSEYFINATLISGPYDIIPASCIIQNDVKTYTDVANKSLLVTNTSVIATGMPSESDDNYRYRITTALPSFVKSNYFGVHETITALPGISDISVNSANGGGGTFSVFVRSISPIADSTLLSDVQKVVYQCVPPWANYNIAGPSYIGLKVSLQVTVTSLSSIANQNQLIQQIITTVSSFINNVPSRAFDIKEIENIVIASNTNITNASLVTATIFRGETFREATIVDLTNVNSRYISISTSDKLVSELVTVSLQ